MWLECEWCHAGKQWSGEFEDFEKQAFEKFDFGPSRQRVGLSAIEADGWEVEFRPWCWEVEFFAME